MNAVETTRESGFAEFKSNPSVFIKKYREQGLTLGEGLQNEFSKKDRDYNHPVVGKDFLARDGLQTRSTTRKGSSPISEFDTDWKRALLLDDMESAYQLSFGSNVGKRKYRFISADDRYEANMLERENLNFQLTDDMRMQLEDSALIKGFTPGSAFRPFNEQGIETPPFEPDVPYADLGTVDVVDTVDMRVAQFTVDKSDLLMKHVPIGTPAPTIKLSVGSQEVEAFRHSIGIEIGDFQRNSSVPGIVEGLRRMVEEIGSRQADAFSNTLASVIIDGVTIPGSAAATNIDALLDMQTSLTNGSANRVIGSRRAVLNYLGRQANLGTTVQNQASDAVRIVGQTRLGNRSASTETAYFFRDEDAAGIGSENGALWFFDRMRCLGIMEYLRGEMDASDFNPETAMHRRFFARVQGYWLKHQAQRVAFRVLANS